MDDWGNSSINKGYSQQGRLKINYNNCFKNPGDSTELWAEPQQDWVSNRSLCQRRILAPGENLLITNYDHCTNVQHYFMRLNPNWISYIFPSKLPNCKNEAFWLIILLTIILGFGWYNRINFYVFRSLPQNVKVKGKLIYNSNWEKNML